MYNGFINLYKSPNISSNRALSILKRALKQNNIVTKVGHFGTLDPIAEGVLPVALGRATRLFDYSLDKVKKYVATFRFGVETDTLDHTGQVLSTGRSDVTIEEIESVIPNLLGTVDQVPPIYSAKTVNGVRSYKRARKGESFDLPAKTVRIFSIKLLKKIPNEQNGSDFVFEIECGGGTYIRSIVRDMAYLMGTVGIMSSLIRTQSGIFTANNAISMENLEKNVVDLIIPMDVFLQDFPKIYLSNEQYTLLKNGLSVDFSCVSVQSDVDTSEKAFYTVYMPVPDVDPTQYELMGIGEQKEGCLRLKTWLL